jgi:LmbE family N-acetylglucosaminyl deacetylase
LGAHCDDIEIGCGGTFLQLAKQRPDIDVLWVVFCSNPVRASEARASAAAFLAGFVKAQVVVKEFKDGYLPYSGAGVKDEFEVLKQKFAPDVVFTHGRDDRHQDHRVVSDLTWNTWRDHVVLEYEIPKYDGDFGQPNAYHYISAAMLERKIELLTEHYPSQVGRQWFTPDLFRAVPRIRGMESVAPEGLAEAFTCRKAVL